MKCQTCNHDRRLHSEKGCRVTGCGCTAFVGHDPAQTGARRVCVDVPDGYTLSISLIPWSDSEDRT